MTRVENDVNQVHELIEKFFPHKHSFATALHWTEHCRELSLSELQTLRNTWASNDRERIFLEKALKILRPELYSPLYQAMRENDE